MSPQLRLAETVPDRRSSLQQESRLCLALANAALSGLAALSPAARAAIETVLDEAMAEGVAGYGEAAQVLSRIRDQIKPTEDDDASRMRSLEEAILAKARSLPEPAVF
jgi:hypothetical protein